MHFSFFLCVISFLYYVKFICLFNVFVLRGRLDLNYVPTCTDLLGTCFSLICPYQNTNTEKGYYSALSFSSFLSVFFQNIVSDLLTPTFIPRFLSITIPIGCVFLIINVSSRLDITWYLLYP